MESLPIPAGDLAPKYQKLAAEYSKLRVHVKVLKKGVVEEQARGEELRALLRDKEIELRKSELEIDSLQFRNAQLARRIAVLQDELRAEQTKWSKKGRSRGMSSGSAPGSEELGGTPDTGLMQEELQKKILENAQFSSQLSDRTFEISQLRAALADYERLITDNENKYKCEIAKLKHRNQEVQHQLDELIKERSRASFRQTQGTAGNTGNTPCNGDLISEIGSLVGSEDAPSSADELQANEQLFVQTQQLEQENERLKMECELVAMENESLKIEVMKHCAGPRGRRDSTDVSHLTQSVVDAGGRLVGLLASVQVPFDLSEEIRAREHQLQCYFRNKITQLKSEKQALESKTLHYIRECELLRLRYEEAEREHELTDQTLQHKHDTITRLEEELQSTSHNYSQQLAVLTEHVADLTDKLSHQHNEMQHLRARRK